MQFHNLKDIFWINQCKYIEEIKEGFSNDLKYYIISNLDEELLVRVSEKSYYDKKKQENNIINQVYKLGIPSLQAIDHGWCNNKNNVYTVHTWIKGQNLEKVLPLLSEEKQYMLGVEAGKILKKIHSIKPFNQKDWYSTRTEQYLYNYQKYKQHNIQYKYEKEINNYINDNINILNGQEISLVHGDYHLGNMILSSEEKVNVIDFDRFDWKASIEDFYKLAVFSRNVSIQFCRGQIDGYTDCTPSLEFWDRYCLCVAMTSLLSLLWGKTRSEDMYIYRKKLCDTLVEDHDCFTKKIPKWYKNAN